MSIYTGSINQRLLPELKGAQRVADSMVEKCQQRTGFRQVASYFRKVSRIVHKAEKDLLAAGLKLNPAAKNGVES